MSDSPLADLTWPAAWRALIPDLAGRVCLEVAGFDTTVEITPAQLERVYFPLLEFLDRTAASSARRVLAALAGVPGCGKSTFAAALAHVAGTVLGPDDLIVVGMDGWHFPNAVLDTRTTRDPEGRTIPLRERKGGPESFDVPALLAALRLLQSGGEVRLPVYDRRIHDPVPDALVVPAAARIVVVEGNYLLCEEEPWSRMGALFSPRLFLECNPNAARDRIIARHLRGGASPDAATTRQRLNDEPNTQLVLATAANADLLVCLEPGPRLSVQSGRFQVEVPGQPPISR